MIATNEAADVLRHGWQDAASTLAADVPEVAELLQARLEMAITTDRLDEHNLLDTIQEVESVTARAGSPSSQALGRRLRRTVYEYLLALDAARPSETNRASVDQAATAADGPMVGAEEVAALGHASATRSGEEAAGRLASDGQVEAGTPEAEPQTESAKLVSADLDDDVDTNGEPQALDAAPSRRRFALRRRQRQDGDPATDGSRDGEITAAGDVVAAGIETDDESAQTAPEWQYTPVAEPAVFQSDTGAATEVATTDAATTVEDLAGASSKDATVDPDATHAPGAEVHPATEGEPGTAVAPPQESDTTPTAGFVAPRAGFHIVEDAPAHRTSPPDEARLEMPAFSADSPTPTNDQGSPFLAWRPADSATASSPADVRELTPADPPAATDDVAVPEFPGPAPADAVPVDTPDGQPVSRVDEGTEVSSPAPDDDDDDAEQRGWGVRRPGEAHASRRSGNPAAAVAIDDDPFENNSRLADIRRRIEDRLRKKRCDEAAALLQELAQEAGGRAVAELAMNAGDRCRALGKSNAALNCYLAAARSDPIYELPLSRLADICIDNQDTELAVSYLERIARLYRYRGDHKAAIRIYRRIATVAPYRDDVLALLMNAQRTGRLE